MGYYSSVKGKINITRLTTPELPVEIKEELDKRGLKITSQYKGLSPEAVEEIQQIEELTGYVWVDSRGLYGLNENNKVYELESGLKKALEIIVTDGCYAEGFLAVFGEEGGDIWRLVVRNEKVIEEHAEIRWPDGTKVEL